MDLGRSGTTPYIFTFRLILTRFFAFGKGKWLMGYNLWLTKKSPLFKPMISSQMTINGLSI